ncbi:MAG: DUF389 domain-containing protein [Calothrix sp. MO_167.B12]|nr:DUF389 domain-containing protein [Calothrix sp. MO_167.B12]
MEAKKGFRDWFATNMGITNARKEEIYCDLLNSVTLQDVSYWLQVLFSAAIATLGLILDSPAVIIGAMLISPLMGMILANGLAFAAGDLILAIRALINLVLSCLVAIALAFLLVAILPLKGLNSAEIAARIKPNVLDLVIALFSGALGSIATCKVSKGAVTSIPGVAIAVALMPPLCVVGYGIGVTVSLNLPDGLKIARGGGLLFLTNLTAITLMAMLVFLTIKIDTPSIRKQVPLWHKQDQESHGVQQFLERIPVPTTPLEIIGSLPSRLIVILIPLLTLLFPLSQSFTQLNKEINQKQKDNQIIQIGTEIWREQFANFPNGESRSDINKLLIREQNQKLLIQMNVITKKFYTTQEKKEYTEIVASRLNRTPDSISLQLIEIPTASNDIIADLVAAIKSQEQEATQELAPTVTETQINFLKSTEAALRTFKLPAPAQLLRYEAITSNVEALSLNLVYLSDREIGADAKNLLIDDIRTSLNFPNAQVRFQRISPAPGSITFPPDSTTLQPANTQLLNRIAQILKQQPNLGLEIIADVEGEPSKEFTQRRIATIKNYLVSNLQISTNKISITAGKVTARRTVSFKILKKGEI